MLSRWCGIMTLAALACAAAVPGTETPTGKDGRRTIAVMYFQNNAMLGKEAMAPLEKGLADMLITELSKIGALQVVERVQLQHLIKEMKVGQTGMVDQNTAQEMGKLLGAETLLLGSFATDMKGEKMRIDARIVETETGLTLKAEEITDKTKSLFKMVDKLTRKIARELDVKLTKEDKQRLKKVENKSFQAAIYYSKGLDFEDEEEYGKALEMYEKALEINPDYARAKVRIQAVEEKLD